MKPSALNTRTWQPGTWITVSGIVLCPQHVKAVCTVAQNDAVATTTEIIERLVKS